jgi:hypothetical protein
VVLEVDDDGRGFDPANVRPGGQGLGNLRERALAIGGRVEFDSHPGEGTRVRGELPRPSPPGYGGEHDPGRGPPGQDVGEGLVDRRQGALLVGDVGAAAGVQLEDLGQVHPGADDRTATVMPCSTVSSDRMPAPIRQQ